MKQPGELMPPALAALAVEPATQIRIIAAIRCWQPYGFSGVRPFSGAETLENDASCEISGTLERAEGAAAEDGRAPVNRYWPASSSSGIS